MQAVDITQGKNKLIINYRGNEYPVSIPRRFLETDSYKIKVNIAGLKKEYGDIKKMLERAYLGSAKRLKLLLFKANFYYNEGQFDKSFDILDEAEKDFPSSEEVKTMKGSLFYVLGAPELAISKWEESIEINPEQEGLKKFLERVKNARIKGDEKTQGSDIQENKDNSDE